MASVGIGGWVVKPPRITESGGDLTEIDDTDTDGLGLSVKEWLWVFAAPTTHRKPGTSQCSSHCSSHCSKFPSPKPGQQKRAVCAGELGNSAVDFWLGAAVPTRPSNSWGPELPPTIFDRLP